MEEKKRTLHELYLLLWEEIKHDEYILGLCFKIGRLRAYGVVTEEEYIRLITHFENNKPSEELHTEFYTHLRFIGKGWWWNNEEASDPINRKAFIQKLIEITKPI